MQKISESKKISTILRDLSRAHSKEYPRTCVLIQATNLSTQLLSKILRASQVEDYQVFLFSKDGLEFLPTDDEYRNVFFSLGPIQDELKLSSERDFVSTFFQMAAFTILNTGYFETVYFVSISDLDEIGLLKSFLKPSNIEIFTYDPSEKDGSSFSFEEFQIVETPIHNNPLEDYDTSNYTHARVYLFDLISLRGSILNESSMLDELDRVEKKGFSKTFFVCSEEKANEASGSSRESKFLTIRSENPKLESSYFLFTALQFALNCEERTIIYFISEDKNSALLAKLCGSIIEPEFMVGKTFSYRSWMNEYHNYTRIHYDESSPLRTNSVNYIILFKKGLETEESVKAQSNGKIFMSLEMNKSEEIWKVVKSNFERGFFGDNVLQLRTSTNFSVEFNPDRMSLMLSFSVKDIWDDNFIVDFCKKIDRISEFSDWGKIKIFSKTQEKTAAKVFRSYGDSVRAYEIFFNPDEYFFRFFERSEFKRNPLSRPRDTKNPSIKMARIHK
mgnify:CR=1 FL=1